MKTKTALVAVIFSLTLLAFITRVTAQRVTGTDSNPAMENDSPNFGATDDEALRIVKLTVPVIAVLIVLVIIFIGIVYMVYRARYGAFCCLKPKMIYRPHHNEGGLESGSSDHHVPGTPPPEYDSTHMEYPPDYQDALKDIILSTGSSNLPYYAMQELIVPEYEPSTHAQNSTESNAQTEATSQRNGDEREEISRQNCTQSSTESNVLTEHETTSQGTRGGGRISEPKHAQNSIAFNEQTECEATSQWGKGERRGEAGDTQSTSDSTLECYYDENTPLNP